MAEQPQDLERIKQGAGKDLSGVDDTPDKETRAEKDDEQSLEVDRLRAVVHGLKQDIDERKSTLDVSSY